MAEIDYKSRYDDLKIKFIRAMEVAKRMGYVQGYKDAQLASLQQQVQQMSAQPSPMTGAAPMQGAPDSFGNQPIQDGPEQLPMNNENIEPGSDLDQSINELESLVTKHEISDAAIATLQKAINNFKALPSRVSKNLSPKEIQTNTIQKKIVDDILKKWDDETAHSANRLLNIIETEGNK
jgi:hypothetical protein